MMKDERKRKDQLIRELLELRLKVAEYEVHETCKEKRKDADAFTRELFRDIVENTNDLIQTLTPEGGILYVNKAWLKALGYTRNEVKKLRIENIIHPDGREQCHMFFPELLKGRKIGKFETALITKDGRKIDVEVSSHSKLHNGKPLYVQCILHDITQRKHAEKSLQEYKTLEASLIGAIPHAVFGLKNRSIVFVNDEVEKVFGWKAEELLGKATEILYRNRSEYEEIGRRVYSALEKQKTYSEEFPCRKKDGSQIICKVSASLLRRGTNDRQAVVVYEDITDKKRMEDALLQSEQKYLDFYQNAPDGYHSIGPDGTFLEVNSTWLKMLGYREDEVVNRMKFKELLPEREHAVFEKTFPILKEKGSIDNIEYKFRKKDGSLLPVLLRATAIYDAQGKFLKTRTIVRDISARENYKHMLEQTVEEWRITFDSMPYGVLLLDMEFSILRANKYFSALYKIPFTELNGKKFYDVIGSTVLSKNMQDIITRKTLNLEGFEYHDEKAEKDFLLYFTPIPGPEGLTRSFVLALMDISELKDKEKKLTDSRDAFFNMLKELDFSYRELKGLHEGLIHSFVNAIDEKSPWTKGHSERVTNYAVSIAKELDLPEDEIEALRIAALLHDIGKIGTYDVILDNPNKLSSREVNLINLHPVKGERILEPLKQMKHILPIVRHHHERIDGQGYPDRLRGEQIPFLARILCVADSFDSMTSDRPYRSAGTREYAISELKRCRDLQFDTKAVDAFLKILGEV